MTNKVFKKPKSLINLPFPYCPGCSHGINFRLITEIVDELGIQNDVIGMTPVGCSVRGWRHLDYDMYLGAHGRNPAVATAMKRSRPDAFVFSYQGDGDMAAIGMGEIIHAAARSERITVILANNSIFGATGGQMAPTTLIDQYSTTDLNGRDPKKWGYPIKMAEIIAEVSEEAYVARGAVNEPQNINKTKKYIRKAFETQLNDKGFSFVEILSSCPSNWQMNPTKSVNWMEDNMFKTYPLGEFANPGVSK